MIHSPESRAKPVRLASLAGVARGKRRHGAVIGAVCGLLLLVSALLPSYSAPSSKSWSWSGSTPPSGRMAIPRPRSLDEEPWSEEWEADVEEVDESGEWWEDTPQDAEDETEESSEEHFWHQVEPSAPETPAAAPCGALVLGSTGWIPPSVSETLQSEGFWRAVWPGLLALLVLIGSCRRSPARGICLLIAGVAALLTGPVTALYAARGMVVWSSGELVNAFLLLCAPLMFVFALLAMGGLAVFRRHPDPRRSRNAGRVPATIGLTCLLCLLLVQVLGMHYAGRGFEWPLEVLRRFSVVMPSGYEGYAQLTPELPARTLKIVRVVGSIAVWLIAVTLVAAGLNARFKSRRVARVALFVGLLGVCLQFFVSGVLCVHQLVNEYTVHRLADGWPPMLSDRLYHAIRTAAGAVLIPVGYASIWLRDPLPASAKGVSPSRAARTSYLVEGLVFPARPVWRPVPPGPQGEPERTPVGSAN